MGKALCERFPVARECFERADDVLGFDLATLCFEGPEERLRETRNTQPALFVKSAAVWRVLGDSLSPSYVAGHSLGEYSALYAAGALSFEDALRAVRRRGELMWESGVKRPGTMAAILGLDAAGVESLVSAASSEGIVQPANLNCPGQVVLSGEVAAVMRAVDLAPEHGAKKAVALNVSGAFHSALMADAQAELSEFLAGIEFEDARIPVVSNVSARPVTDGAALRTNLVAQMTAPVRWEESMRFLLDDGVTEFYEVGAGKVLRGLLRTIDRGAKVVPIGTPEEVDAVLTHASGEVH
jgi:[acyl-carrier-protein] S-malonyltransferase